MHVHVAIRGLLANAWILFFVVWMIMAMRVKSTLKRQSSSSRLAQVVLGGLAYVLLFTNAFHGGFLSIRVVPAMPVLTVFGVAVTYTGIAFSIWARFVLGGNWSSDVTLKKDHSLVCSGPYALVRHPIYTGLLLAMLGTALVVAEAHAFLGVLFGFASFGLKFREEERFMTEQFGADYEEYRRRTPALVPFVI